MNEYPVVTILGPRQSDDVRQLINLRDATVIEKFLRLLAGRTAQILTMKSLGNDAGIDAKTIKHWLSVLEASFIILMRGNNQTGVKIKSSATLQTSFYLPLITSSFLSTLL